MRAGRLLAAELRVLDGDGGALTTTPARFHGAAVVRGCRERTRGLGRECWVVDLDLFSAGTRCVAKLVAALADGQWPT